MNLKNNYWYFSNVLSPKFCDKLIDHSKKTKLITAQTGKEAYLLNKKNKLSKKEVKNLKKTRDSNIVFLDDQWIYDEITPFIQTANKNADWNFDINWFESCQFTKYKLNQHYDWHADNHTEPYNSKDPNFNNKIRKISAVCSLSDPKDFEGGQLQFLIKQKLNNEKDTIVTCNEILPRGSIIVFPSFVIHRVTPVIKGTRYSLVMWSLGYPFK
jgi:PKHD-type hydroxylase